MTTEKRLLDEYLGDGVYASFDGYHIVLDLRAQDNTTKIAIEPAVFHQLVGYKERIDEYIRLQINQAGNEDGNR